MIDLRFGDCLEIMPTIEAGSVDLILTDPPYGTTACKWDSVIPFDPMWNELKRIIKPNGAIVLFGSEPFSSALRMSNIKHYKYDWVWDKITAKGHMVAKFRPMQQNELLSVFGAEKINYYPVMIDRPKDKWKTSKECGGSEIVGNSGNGTEYKTYKTWYPKNILKFSNAIKKEKLHPTQKPVALLEYLIKTYTNPGETVLDFTMGSGSTGVAAKNLGRSFIGIEKDPDYFKIAEKRINETKTLSTTRHRLSTQGPSQTTGRLAPTANRRRKNG